MKNDVANITKNLIQSTDYYIKDWIENQDQDFQDQAGFILFPALMRISFWGIEQMEEMFSGVCENEKNDENGDEDWIFRLEQALPVLRSILKDDGDLILRVSSILETSGVYPNPSIPASHPGYIPAFLATQSEFLDDFFEWFREKGESLKENHRSWFLFTAAVVPFEVGFTLLKKMDPENDSFIEGLKEVHQDVKFKINDFMDAFLAD